MKYYFAPMEGITSYIYRKAYHQIFYPMDKYFTPFLVPNQNHCLKAREINDILPEHNEGLYVVPQLLTNDAEDFIWAAKELKNYGYQEINLNLGCPSATVVAKRKGSGFLSDPQGLERFLDRVCSETGVKLSVKTRIGKESPDEFRGLLQIYNKYPLEELIIHPRIQTDYYKNKPNLKVFGEGLENSGAPVCYNGDLFTTEDRDNLLSLFPDIKCIMLGRGVTANPGLCGEMNGQGRLNPDQLLKFHSLVYEGYREILSDRNALFKMKELWSYLSLLFPESKKHFKKIKKAERVADYERAVTSIFQEFREPQR